MKKLNGGTIAFRQTHKSPIGSWIYANGQYVFLLKHIIGSRRGLVRLIGGGGMLMLSVVACTGCIIREHGG